MSVYIPPSLVEAIQHIVISHVDANGDEQQILTYTDSTTNQGDVNRLHLQQKE